jgi:hypothetical protein
MKAVIALPLLGEGYARSLVTVDKPPEISATESDHL